MHHRADLRGGIHHNRHLQSAWNIYKEENFLFYIIEYAPLDRLNERESYWISKLDTLNDGYNFDLGGDGIRGYKHSDNEINKMRRIQSPEIVLQFDMNFNLIKEWIGGCNHIRKELGGGRTAYADRCNHSQKTMTPYKNSYWVYKNEYDNPQFSWDNYLKNISLYTATSRSRFVETKRIYQYDFEGNLIKEWESLESLGISGLNRASIINAINHKNGKKTYKDYVWSYNELSSQDSAFVGLTTIQEKNQKFGKMSSKKVAQIDKDGNILKMYDSGAEACRLLGKNPSDGRISIAARSNRTKGAYGYLWEYING